LPETATVFLIEGQAVELNVYSAPVITAASYDAVNEKTTLTFDPPLESVYYNNLGDATIASGDFSEAIGGSVKANGRYSKAQGIRTYAQGDASYAIGYYTSASGEASHAEGHGTRTVSDYQHAQGIFNLPVSGAGAFILGNGIDRNNRRNLIFAQGTTVQVTGSLQVSGSITATGSVTINNNRIDDAWTSYTPTFTTDGTQPILGDGTITGAYKIIGKTCFVRVKLNPGSTTTFGSGALLFGLPVNAASPDGIQFPCSILNQGSAWYQGTVNGTYKGQTDKSAIIVQSNGGVNSSEAVTATMPITFGASDSIQFNGSYEIA
jgi:hypothetical protein